MAMVIKARGGPNNRPGNRKEAKMGRRFGGNEELCPECGHLLTTKSWNCQFCGWNMDKSKMHTSAVDLWNDYPDIDNISFVGCVFYFLSFPLIETIVTRIMATEERAESLNSLNEPPYWQRIHASALAFS